MTAPTPEQQKYAALFLVNLNEKIGGSDGWSRGFVAALGFAYVVPEFTGALACATWWDMPDETRQHVERTAEANPLPQEPPR